jgi:hypothetical protein
VAVAGLGFIALPLLGTGYATVYVFAAVLSAVALVPGLRWATRCADRLRAVVDKICPRTL